LRDDRDANITKSSERAIEGINVGITKDEGLWEGIEEREVGGDGTGKFEGGMLGK
jgi:hypothetical protein